jgi:UDP-glucose 4-epimerase
MRALVTGGSGFIGSHVVDKLAERGVTVRILDTVPPHRTDVERYDVSLLDFERLRPAMNGVDMVFHLGAVADVKDAAESPQYTDMINTRGTINVLEAARRAGVRRVIYGSTTWVYSDTNGILLDEDSLLNAPSHIYTATKLASEYYCKAYSQLYKLPFTILRYGIPYGPRARLGAVIPIFVKKALQGEPLTIAGDGLQFRKFVYVEDLAEGNVLALKPVAENKIYNLEGSEKVSIRQIAETIQKILGKVEIKFVEGRPGDFSGKEISNRRALEDLGWEPRVSFEEGVRRYIEWYRKQEELREKQWAKVDSELR